MLGILSNCWANLLGMGRWGHFWGTKVPSKEEADEGKVKKKEFVRKKKKRDEEEEEESGSKVEGRDEEEEEESEEMQRARRRRKGRNWTPTEEEEGGKEEEEGRSNSKVKKGGRKRAAGEADNGTSAEKERRRQRATTAAAHRANGKDSSRHRHNYTFGTAAAVANSSPPVIIRVESMMEREMEDGGGGSEEQQQKRSGKKEETEQEQDQQQHKRKQHMIRSSSSRRRTAAVADDDDDGYGEGGEGQQKKNLSLSAMDIRLRRSSHCSVTSSSSSSQQPRPSSSSLIGGDQFCPGKPCARIRLSVQYSQQKKLLIITLNELVQIVGEDIWPNESGQRHQDKSVLQIRLALLSECATAKVQKFQSKVVPLDPLIPIHFGQTFAFDVELEQLAESVVRMRLYRKCRPKKAFCVGVAFLRNCLVDAGAKKARNHFLQFRRVVEPGMAETVAKGSMSLFPSLLSLHPNHPHHPSSPAPPSPSPSSPSPSSSSLNPSCSTSSAIHRQNSPSPSRRGSTVDVESGRFCSLPQADGRSPELLISLCFFNEQNRLTVGVDKAALRQEGTREDGKEREVFVRIAAVSRDGSEMAKHKSATVKVAHEVSLNTQAAFSLSRAELDSTHILVQLFATQFGGILLRRKARRIGSLTLGEYQCSSADASEHWNQMLQGMGTTVDKWHILEMDDAKDK